MPSPIIDGLFGGSILAMQRRLGIPGATTHRVWREAACAASVAWLPLAAISLAQSPLCPDTGLRAFLADRAIHCRALIAVPALILGRAICYRRLSKTCSHFDEAGLISPLDKPRFDAAIASARRLENSPGAVILAFALAYSLIFAFLATSPVLPTWHVGCVTRLGRHSPAGWWHILVSLPVLMVLLLGWLWRLVLWARLLWTVSCLNLELVPSHPDRAAGLKFLGYALRSFAPLAFALGVIVAGALANGAARHELPLAAYRDAAVGLVLCVVVLFGAPLSVFVRPLTAVWQRGIHQYGSFAHALGQGFERKWLRGVKPDAMALGQPDFSALNDAYQCVANVYGMRVLPIDVQSLLLLSASAAIPVLVVALTSLPLEVIGGVIANLMF